MRNYFMFKVGDIVKWYEDRKDVDYVISEIGEDKLTLIWNSHIKGGPQSITYNIDRLKKLIVEGVCEVIPCKTTHFDEELFTI